MSRSKKQKPKSAGQLLNNYVWCAAGKTRGKWIHHLTCAHLQKQGYDNCLRRCRWYKELHKLANVRERQTANLEPYIEEEIKQEIEEELNNKKERKKYFQQIPKNK